MEDNFKCSCGCSNFGYDEWAIRQKNDDTVILIKILNCANCDKQYIDKTFFKKEKNVIIPLIGKEKDLFYKNNCDFDSLIEND